MTDNDLNAASNHEVDLIDLQSIWQEHVNRTTGWLENKVLIGQESIVPDTKKE
jgi:hypothetical protein